MKVLFLDQYSELGGAQRGLIDTIDAAQQRGWQAFAGVPPHGPLVSQLRARRVAIIEIPCGPYSSGRKNAVDMLRFGWQLPGQVRTISRLCRDTGCDLLYVNGPRLLPAVALAQRKEVRVLFHAHSHISERSAMRAAGWGIRRAGATVVTCSKSVLEGLRAYAGADRQHILANGVRDAGFHERAFHQKKSWHIGMVGRISPEKGQAEFLHAAALLVNKLPDVRLSIYGAPLFSDPAYFDQVRGLARGLPVEFPGWRDSIDSVLSELDLLAVPSQQEGMGRVIVEAFSAGVPVVAFPAGGIPEVVRDGETGFLTREMSAEALAARIGDAIRSGPETLNRIAANARRDWERSYTLDRYQQRITDLMERLVSDSPAGHETAALPARK